MLWLLASHVGRGLEVWSSIYKPRCLLTVWLAYIAERWLEPGTEYAVRRTMPAEWYRGWAPEVAQASPPADADVAQYSIQVLCGQGVRGCACCQLCVAPGRLKWQSC